MMYDELKNILEKHKRWLNQEKDGERADLRGVDLRDTDLRYADLCGADLCGADLCGADLRGADLRYTDLRGSDLRDADLCGANLCDADLYGTDLRGADLCDADLCGACLCDADLRVAYLCGSDLRGADLRGANLHVTNLCGAKNVPYIPMACPDTGEFTAWKKAQRYIVKLLIPADAKRSSATGRKCRCDKAIVLAIETIEGQSAELDKIASNHDSSFIYKVGETVKVDNFCEDRFDECSAGIHFFINRNEAVNYC